MAKNTENKLTKGTFTSVRYANALIMSGWNSKILFGFKNFRIFSIIYSKSASSLQVDPQHLWLIVIALQLTRSSAELTKSLRCFKHFFLINLFVGFSKLLLVSVFQSVDPQCFSKPK